MVEHLPAVEELEGEEPIQLDHRRSPQRG